MSNKSGVSEQVISLPKGGGALKGIGEKFSADLHTGTGNFTVPIDLPSGRNDFGPELSLTYSTGNGNSAFGQGWQLSVPGVSRKTSDGVPRYVNAEDTFILSGAEDLVPVEHDEKTNVTTYRPRTEGLFARIVRHHGPGNDYWEVHSKDGLTSTYGTPDSQGTDPAVVADPNERTNVFAWRLTRTKDPFGNEIVYEYDRDSGTRNRRNTGEAEWDQTYLKRIKYVNIDSESDDGPETRHLVSVDFEYERRSGEPESKREQERPDPFSDYSAGFEIRTRKRCKEITVKTHVDEERNYSVEGQPIRRYKLIYQDERNDRTAPLNGASLLSKVEVTGHKMEGEVEETQRLPPLEFGYTGFDPRGRDFDPVEGDVPTRSLANPDMELADIDTNGLPDIVEMNGTVRYWRNLGNGEFDKPRLMREAPPEVRLADPGVQLLDADGNGRIDLMVSGNGGGGNGGNGPAGYYRLQSDGGWDEDGFQRYESAPSVDLEGPETKLMDLTGDGVTDALHSSSRMVGFFNDPKKGWYKTRSVTRRGAEEFPDVSFSDPRVKLGSVSGSGLQDIVLVHDGNVEYWPNLGHGNWGRRIHMRNSPRLPHGYDPQRVLPGDVNGDGLADLVYVDDNRVLLWINKSGNAWSDRIEIDGTPAVTDADAVRLVDLYGTGVQGVLWSADARGSRDNMFFLDFTDGTKPNVLHEMDNHMGALTCVEYAPSTEFYLKDQADPETRWRTSLPFPVQVVKRVETVDQISENKLTTEYRYHHGHWDGGEREFRGFGRTDQLDTSTFSRYNNGGQFDADMFETVDEEQFSPPTLTKTWFHQGPVQDTGGRWREVDYRDEYWATDPRAISRSENTATVLGDLRREGRYDAFRDALRSLRGHVLRTELYALDGDDRADRPYTVTESSYGIRLEETELRPETNRTSRRERTRSAVFFPHVETERTSQWERGDEPMTQFSLTGAYDEHGQPQASMSVALPRGHHDVRESLPSTKSYLGTYSVTEYAKDNGAYILDRVARTTTYEVSNSEDEAAVELGTRLRDEIEVAIDAGRLPTGDPIGQSVNFYDGNAFEGASFGVLGTGPGKPVYGALTRTESLVLTDEILAEAYPVGDEVLSYTDLPFFPGLGSSSNTGEYPEAFQDRYDETRYDRRPGLRNTHLGFGYSDRVNRPYVEGYYVATERRKYDFHDASDSSGRGLVTATRDPLGNETTINYDSVGGDEFGLFPTSVVGPTGLETQAEYNYRVMQPAQVTDPNENRTVVEYTPLGLPASIAPLGAENEDTGDSLDQPGTRFEYDFSTVEERSSDDPDPVSVHTIKREEHEQDRRERIREERDRRVAAGEPPLTDAEIAEKFSKRTIETREYSDGFGRLVQTRSQAEDIAFGDDRFGNLLVEVALLVPENGAYSPENEADLRDRKLGVPSNTEVHRFCEERFGDTQVEMVSYPDESRTIDGLNAGEVDVIALEVDVAMSSSSSGSSPRVAFTVDVDRVTGREGAPAGHPRVTVSGWQTFDNKGQVVEKFEPFFDTGWEYLSRAAASADGERFGARVRMFYDPRGQVIRTVNPDGSEQCVAQGTIDQSTLDATLDDRIDYQPSPWEVSTFDANDNAHRSKGSVDGLPHVSPPEEYRHHWNTPSSARVDALGRTVETTERTRATGETDPEDVDAYRTRSKYDIRGNVTSVRDSLARSAFEYWYNLANTPLRTDSLDAGVRATVFDAAGNEVERRDSKGARTVRTHDELNRPVRTWARDRESGRGEPDPPLTLREYLIYGDSRGGPFRNGENRPFRTEAYAQNLLGKLYVHYDEAGKLSYPSYDFKGNVLTKVRRVLTDTVVLDQGPIDWSSQAGATPESREGTMLDPEDAYETTFQYDALNRQTKLTYPEDVDGDRKSLLPRYNRAGALEQVSLARSGTELSFVERIVYNARGQRTVIAYGNGAITRYIYEPKTFRIRRLHTTTYTRTNKLTYQTRGDVYQNLTYSYDLVGNITNILDQTPNCGVTDTPRGRDELRRQFDYDPLYRLVSATGRECAALLNERPMTDYEPCGYYQPGPGASPPHVTRGNAPEMTVLYREKYDYDPAGNLTRMRHGSGDNGPRWTRQFGFGNRTPLEWEREWKNRVSSDDEWSDGPRNWLTGARDDPPRDEASHEYDRSGNMTAQRPKSGAAPMSLTWDHADRLCRYTDTVNPSTAPSTEAHYCYDTSGQRVKKLVKKNKQVEVTIAVDALFERHYRRPAPDQRREEEYDSLHVTDQTTHVAVVRIGDSIAPNDGRPAVEYYLGDHLESSILTLDDAGQWISYEEYSPYGETTFGGFERKRFRFTGKERDEESGLYFHGDRYYASWLARWTSCDPLGLQESINLYSYTSGNPITLVDPRGRSERTPPVNQVSGPAPKERYAIDTYANQRKIPQAERVGGENLQAHHPVQQQWAKENVMDYDPNKAPTQFLETKGSPDPAKRGEHTVISTEQQASRPRNGRWNEKSTSAAFAEAAEQYQKADLVTDNKRGLNALLEAYGSFFELGDEVSIDPETGKKTVIKNARFADQLERAAKLGEMVSENVTQGKNALNKAVSEATELAGDVVKTAGKAVRSGGKALGLVGDVFEIFEIQQHIENRTLPGLLGLWTWVTPESKNLDYPTGTPVYDYMGNQVGMVWQGRIMVHGRDFL